MTTTLRAKFDGKVFVPSGPVDVPAGAEFTLQLEPVSTSTEDPPLVRLGRALDQLPSDPNAPTDGAIQHDHYLYGTPKRENR